MKWGPFASSDWNGDGKIDFRDDAYEFTMVMQQIDEADRENRIRTLERAIIDSGLSQIGNEEFAALCSQNGIRMHDFEQSDIDEIQRRLERY